MLRFLLATIIVMSVVFIYSSYPLTTNFVPQLYIPYKLYSKAGDPMLLQHTKVPMSWKKEIVELNNTGEFCLGDDGTENITVTNDYIGGFPDMQRAEGNIETISGKLWGCYNYKLNLYTFSAIQSFFTGQQSNEAYNKAKEKE